MACIGSDRTQKETTDTLSKEFLNDAVTARRPQTKREEQTKVEESLRTPGGKLETDAEPLLRGELKDSAAF